MVKNLGIKRFVVSGIPLIVLSGLHMDVLSRLDDHIADKGSDTLALLVHPISGQVSMLAIDKNAKQPDIHGSKSRIEMNDGNIRAFLEQSLMGFKVVYAVSNLTDGLFVGGWAVTQRDFRTGRLASTVLRAIQKAFLDRGQSEVVFYGPPGPRDEFVWTPSQFRLLPTPFGAREVACNSVLGGQAVLAARVGADSYYIATATDLLMFAAGGPINPYKHESHLRGQRLTDLSVATGFTKNDLPRYAIVATTNLGYVKIEIVLNDDTSLSSIRESSCTSTDEFEECGSPIRTNEGNVLFFGRRGITRAPKSSLSASYTTFVEATL